MVQHIIQAYILLITRIYLAPAGLGKSTQLATYPGASYAKQSNKVYISVIFQPLNASPLIILDPTRAFLLEPPKGRMLETLGEREFQAAARNELTLQLRNIQSLETFVYCLLFIVLFAISFTKQKKIYLFKLSWRGSPREATGLTRNGLPQLDNQNKILS